MKSLIIYYSKEGNNEQLAEIIEKKLKCRSERIIEIRKRNNFTLFLEMFSKKSPPIQKIAKNPKEFDHLILVSPIWGGVPASPMIAFIKEYAETIKKYSFISLCGGSLGPNKRIGDFLQEKLGKKPKACVELYINDIAPDEKKNKPFKIMKIKIDKDIIQKKFKE